MATPQLAERNGQLAFDLRDAPPHDKAKQGAARPAAGPTF